MRRFVQRLICKRLGSGRVKLRKYGFSLMALSITFFTCYLLSSSATAQTTTSTIEGVITDANGAVIASAEVKAAAEAFALSQPFARTTVAYSSMACLRTSGTTSAIASWRTGAK